VKQRTALSGFAFALVVRASLPDDVAGHEQSDRPVDRSAAPGDLRVRVLGLDLVAEEPRRLAGGVGDQRFGGRKFQLELVAQERRDPRFDLFGFVPRSGESEEPVVGVPHIPKPSIIRIVRVLARYPAAALREQPDRSTVAVASGLRDLIDDDLVGAVALPPVTSMVFRQQSLLDELVHPVQVDVRQDRRCDAALRRAAEWRATASPVDTRP
jgi:hypothetical protein